MAKPSDYPGFKALLSEWNRKLYESGFKDAESDGINPVLKASGSARRYERLDHITREAKEDYFRKVATKVSEANFESEFERDVLTLFSQGNSQTQIYKLLKIEGHRCKIYNPIYKWLKKWGLK